MYICTRARIIFRCWYRVYVRTSKVTAACVLFAITRRGSLPSPSSLSPLPPRHCMLRPFATRGLVATGTMFSRRRTRAFRLVHRSVYVKRLCSSDFARRTLSKRNGISLTDKRELGTLFIPCSKTRFECEC